jgi:hypothetical protein
MLTASDGRQILINDLMRAIAQEEGFGIPGTIPTTHHNPGDLRHSPHSFHLASAPDAIGQIDDDADGWEDLEDQLERYVGRGYTLRQAVYEYAPPSENNTAQYLSFVLGRLSLKPDQADIPLAQAMKIGVPE